MKENQPYDEQRYAGALENMVQQCIDYEDTHEILTEWNKWDNLVQEGYGTLVDQNFEKMIPLWWKTWEIFQKIVKTAEYKIGISGLMESQDYEYPIDAWLQDMEMELGNAGEHEKRVESWKCWTGALMMAVILNPQSGKSYMQKEKRNRGERGLKTG